MGGIVMYELVTASNQTYFSFRILFYLKLCVWGHKKWLYPGAWAALETVSEIVIRCATHLYN
jgi:hypothetical protein